ncbi:MAG: lipoyl(octanoyl) transferase LipB [Flavobacteriales bacterium]|nr:lipoyl(octanoyl) transferase LipB [Flavobacteriales bacterium]
MPKTHFQDLGLIDYKECWELQEEIHDKALQLKIKNRKEETNFPIENHLLFCEHPHVFTLGKSGDFENLKMPLTMLDSIGAKYYHINRGGDITYHGPGQIVGYPIIDLEQFTTDLHQYLRGLEEAIILTLAEYQIEGGRYPGFTGVWLNPDDPTKARKISAIGVRVSRWVTLHGFAFNVNTDLTYFERIFPCGISDKAVTSLAKELGREVDIEEVKNVLKLNLSNVFDFDIVEK